MISSCEHGLNADETVLLLFRVCKSATVTVPKQALSIATLSSWGCGWEHISYRFNRGLACNDFQTFLTYRTLLAVCHQSSSSGVVPLLLPKQSPSDLVREVLRRIHDKLVGITWLQRKRFSG
jgi:hypothetical protein